MESFFLLLLLLWRMLFIYFYLQGQKQLTLGNITQRPDFSGMDCASGYMEMFLESNAKYAKVSKHPLNLL